MKQTSRNTENPKPKRSFDLAMEELDVIIQQYVMKTGERPSEEQIQRWVGQIMAISMV